MGLADSSPVGTGSTTTVSPRPRASACDLLDMISWLAVGGSRGGAGIAERIMEFGAITGAVIDEAMKVHQENA